jgi:parvulin-like peptidyl-prolyl isomerase
VKIKNAKIKSLQTSASKVLKRFKLSPLKVSLFLVLLGLALLAFNFRSLFVAVVVNNQPITRYSLDKALEKQAGQQALDNMITEKLITQEASKQNVTVSKEEIQAKISAIEKQVEAQGQKLDALLSAQGQTRIELESQMKMQLLVEKMLGKDIVINESDLKTLFDQKKTTLPKDSKFENVQEQLRQELFQQKLGEKFQPWIDGLRQKAKIYSFLKF